MDKHHAARDHATWSASSTDRNWNCSGALALTMGLPETTSEAADWGTACHQLSEKCLQVGNSPFDYIGKTEKGKKYSFEVDEEMAETAQTYVDYVRKAATEAATDGANPAWLLQIEQKFSLASLNPPFDAGGTGDAVVYWPKLKMLEVIDLKGGRGVVVEVKGNPQLRTYALGAMLANTGMHPTTVKVTVVQPRAPHADGRIRSETFSVADLVEWTADLVAAMRRAKKALDDKPGMPAAAWATAYLNAGDHCKFCRAAGFCPAQERKALDAAGVWFDDLDQPRLANAPGEMSTEKLAQTLDMLDMISEWINAVRSYAHSQAESGVEIPGYQLVEKIGNRAWKIGDAEVVAALQGAGVAEPYTKKVVSPAQAEKMLGAKKKGVIADLVERPSRGTNLVSVTKTTRPAATPSVHKHLENLDAQPAANLFD